MTSFGPNTTFVINWITRMGGKYGGTVYDTKGGLWDWGQALCRQVWGHEWSKSDAWKEADSGDDVPAEIVEAAKAWEAGEWPAWALCGQMAGVDWQEDAR